MDERRRIAPILIGLRKDQLNDLDEIRSFNQKSRSEIVREAIDYWLEKGGVIKDEDRLRSPRH